MSTVTVVNNDAALSGKTLATTDTAQTVTATKTFDLDPGAPFVVTASSAVVANLDADKVDGQHGSYYNDPANLSSAVTVPKGGTGVATLTNHGVVIGQGASAVAVTGTGSAGQVLTSNGAAADPTFQNAAGVVTLLRANSGTDTNTSATTVDSIAISGLTAKDRLWVLISVEESTQAVARIDLYSVTDATNVCRLTAGGTVSAGVTMASNVVVMQGQTGSTKYVARVESGTTGGDSTETSNNTLATAWTGSWTLGLRQGGVTAGGTFAWSWAVYKVAGQ